MEANKFQLPPRSVLSTVFALALIKQVEQGRDGTSAIVGKEKSDELTWLPGLGQLGFDARDLGVDQLHLGQPAQAPEELP